MFVLKGIIYLVISIILFNIFLSIHNNNKIFRKAKKMFVVVRNNYKIPNGEDDYKPVYYTEYEFKENNETKKCIEYTNTESQIGLRVEKLILKKDNEYHIFEPSMRKKNKILFLIFSFLFFLVSVSCFSNPFEINILDITNYYSNVLIGVLLIILAIKEFKQYYSLNEAIKYELLSAEAEIVDYAVHCDINDNYSYAPVYKCKLLNKTRLIRDTNFREDIQNKKGKSVVIYINPQTNSVFEEEKIDKHKLMTFTYFVIGALFIILTIF